MVAQPRLDKARRKTPFTEAGRASRQRETLLEDSQARVPPPPPGLRFLHNPLSGLLWDVRREPWGGQPEPLEKRQGDSSEGDRKSLDSFSWPSSRHLCSQSHWGGGGRPEGLSRQLLSRLPTSATQEQLLHSFAGVALSHQLLLTLRGLKRIWKQPLNWIRPIPSPPPSTSRQPGRALSVKGAPWSKLSTFCSDVGCHPVWRVVWQNPATSQDESLTGARSVHAKGL